MKKTLDEEFHQLMLDYLNGKLTFIEALDVAHAQGFIDGQERDS